MLSLQSAITIVSSNKVIYHAIYEIRYRLLKRPDEKIIFSFVKEFLDDNEIAEGIFWERYQGKIVNKPSKKGNSFFLLRSNLLISVLILVVYPTVNSLAALLLALKI